jgi:hypothetical protein
VARERNNIYAVTADAVDLALDTAGAIGSMVGGIASAVGLTGSDKEKSNEQDRQDAKDASERVATSLREEADAVKPRSHKVKASSRHVGKKRTTKSVKKAAKPRTARKATR